MGKPAHSVCVGDWREDSNGCRHRVVSRSTGADGRVTTSYHVHRPSGGIDLRRDVGAADAETEFVGPIERPPPDEFESA